MLIKFNVTRFFIFYIIFAIRIIILFEIFFFIELKSSFNFVFFSKLMISLDTKIISLIFFIEFAFSVAIYLTFLKS